MDSLNASDRLRSIVDFLLHFPTREQLVVFLSTGVCPHGEVVGVCTGYLDSNGDINFEFSHGFNDLSPTPLPSCCFWVRTLMGYSMRLACVI